MVMVNDAEPSDPSDARDRAIAEDALYVRTGIAGRTADLEGPSTGGLRCSGALRSRHASWSGCRTSVPESASRLKSCRHPKQTSMSSKQFDLHTGQVFM
jgi:hypothetical protein